MDKESNQRLHTEGAVADYFTIENHSLSTRSADAYKAIDRSRNVPILLWVLKHPLALNSEAVRRFLSRVYSISSINPPISQVTSYGVDSGGTAFSVFPKLDGYSIESGNIGVAEAERRFTAAARLIATLHSNGVVCGDLCSSSFWVNRSGDVQFIGVMGSFDVEAAATAVAPPNDVIPYIAPEQRAGGGITKGCDVFALGVLGYYLLTKIYPYGSGTAALVGDYNISSIKPVNGLIAKPPVWSSEVLMRMLSPSPDDRYGNAGEVLEAISESRKRAYSDSQKPVKISTAASLVDKPEHALTVQPDLNTQRSGGAKTGLRAIGITILLGMLAAVIVLSKDVLFPKHEIASMEDDVIYEKTSEVANDQLKEAINVISEAQVSLAEKAEQLEKIVISDDPIAHAILVKQAKEASGNELRKLAERAVLERARRLGLMRSAAQVNQWLRGVRGNSLPKAYEPVLKSLDTTLPIEARNSFLRQGYAAEPALFLRLAVALAIDLKRLDDYQPVIAQLVGDSLGLEDANSHSSLALVLSSPELSLIFGEDIVQRRNEIPDEDVLWLLRKLAERNDANVRAIASLAVDRGMLSPLRQYFIGLIRDRSNLPPDIVRALIRAAGGVVELEDISSIGRWFDLDAEKIMLAICASIDDKGMLTQTFDRLAAKSLNTKPASSIIPWIRRNQWSKRGDLANAVGVLGHASLFEDKELEGALVPFEPYMRNSELAEILATSGDARITKIVVDNYSEMIGLGGLLSLLKNPDKEVKIAAINNLKGYNDLGALKLIVDAYERERDPEIKQLFRENFWMIEERERSKKKSNG